MLKLLPKFVMGVDIDAFDTHNIHRCLSHDKLGWYLSIQRNKKQKRRQFLDQMYNDSPLLALHYAMEERDQFEAENPLIQSKIGFSASPAANSLLGVPGVTFCRERHKQKACFAASFSVERDGEWVKSNKPYSIPMYGFDQALRLAIKKRKDFEREMLMRAGFDPAELRIQGYDYLDEEMAYRKVMAFFKEDIEALERA